MKRKPQNGFTLIEMLVVMILVSITSAVLIQAMGYLFGIQQRAGSEAWNMQGKAMSEDWFRQVVEGLQPDYTDGRNVFSGADHQFSGLTTNLLAENYGGLGAFSFSLRPDYSGGSTNLVYGNDSIILSMNDTNAKFVYVDEKGEPHDSWPPPLGIWPQLPSSILIEGKDFVLAATPLGPAAPLPRVQDAFGVAP